MIKPYKKSFDYSYTLGFYPTIELIKRRKDLLRCVYVSSSALNSDGYRKIVELIGSLKIIISDNTISKLSDKGNDHVIGVFTKIEGKLEASQDHVVLVNPSDMGNLGNIMRSMLAFGYSDLAIVCPAADEFNPKTIRASMGSFFALRIEKFDSFEQYLSIYERPYIPFMLQANKGLKQLSFFNEPVALVFGNEATGLPLKLLNEEAVKIEQSPDVDSLNLTTAVAIALYEARNA